MPYRDREVVTNPPPSAGGMLLAYALALLDRAPGRRTRWSLVRAMESVAGRPGRGVLRRAARPRASAGRFLSSRVGSTTHVSVLDGAGWAATATT